MISNEHLYEEYKAVEDLLQNKDATQVEILKAVLKMEEIQVKLLHNLRTNSVRIMSHFKIPLVKPAKKGEEGKDKTEE